MLFAHNLPIHKLPVRNQCTKFGRKMEPGNKSLHLVMRREYQAAIASRYKDINSIVIEIEDNGNKYSYILPGLSFDMFDRCGNVGIGSIGCLTGYDRLFCFRKDLSPWTSKLSDNTAYMIVAQHFHVNIEMYTKARLFRPIEVISCLGYMGKSSFSFILDFVDKESSSLLMRCDRHMVAIDRKTERPFVIPDSVRQSVSDYLTRNKTSIPSPPPRPASFHQYEIKVRHSDLDLNYHVNNANFLKFCEDAAMEACISGFYPSYSGDISWYHVKDAYIRYQGECIAGDLLTVSSWEGTSKELNFIIEKGTVPVVTCTMMFYPRQPEPTPRPKI